MRNLSKVFSGISPRYDFLNHVLSFYQDGLWRKKLTGLVALEKNAKILDLCTGTAEIAIEFVQREPTCRVFGVDFSAGMLDEARRKIEKFGFQEMIRLIEADVFDLPFGPENFDVVSIAFGLRNLADPQRGIANMVRMLKKGGRVLILEFSPSGDSLLGKTADIYLKNIPFFAGLFGGSLGAYRYLSFSIRSFLSPKQILDGMRSAGLQNLRRHPMDHGIINLYYGERS